MRTKLVSDGVLPLLILLFSVSSTAMAQVTHLPQYGVILTGAPDDPVVKIKEVARPLPCPQHRASPVPGAGRPGFGAPSFWPRQSARVLLNVRDRMGEAAAFAFVVST